LDSLAFWLGQEDYLRRIIMPILIAVGIVFPVLFLVFTAGLARRWRLWEVGQPEKRTDRWFRRLMTTLAVAVPHVSFFRKGEWYPSFMHLFILGGTGLLFLGKIVRLFSFGGLSMPPQSIYLYASLVSEIGGVVILVGGAMAVFRRYVRRPDRLDTKEDDTLVYVWAFVIVLTGFMVKGYRIATSAAPPPDWGSWSPVGYLISRAFLTFGVTMKNEILVWHRVIIHTLPALGLLGYMWVMRSRLQHIVISPLNVFFRSLGPKGALVPIDLEKAETFGTSAVEQYTWKQLMDLDACTRCGRCQDACPAYASGKALSPKKVVQDLKSHLQQVYPVPFSGKAIEPRPDMICEAITEPVIWDCTTCGACMEACPIYIEQVPKIVEMRRHLVQMKAVFPHELSSLFENMEQRSNPWGVAPGDRAKWAVDLPVKPFEPGKTEYLLFVGCAGAFDARSKQVTVALTQVLNAAGVSWGILGKDEKCCGDSLRRLGNEFVFDRMARDNVKAFQDGGVTKIITQCPHCYNVLKNDYRQYGGSFEVVHHSEFISRLLKAGSLKLGPTADLGKIAIHDSCYLGRYNQVYEAPRQVIEKVTGQIPAEMPRNHRSSFCCGAGGGRMWMEERVGKRINIARVEESLTLDPKTIAVCCPYCLTMFEDGLKDKHADDAVKVLDVSEIVARSLGS
jgi:Fe-S oxidoreductase/nitrate reductase gamma subunit